MTRKGFDWIFLKKYMVSMNSHISQNNGKIFYKIFINFVINFIIFIYYFKPR